MTHGYGYTPPVTEFGFPDHTDCNCALCRLRECVEALREDNAQIRASVGMFKAANEKLNARCERVARQRDEANERILVLDGKLRNRK